MSQKLKTLKEKLRQAIRKELVEYDNLNTRKEKELEERINLFVEKNTPTKPSKWSYYKSQAKKKFDVYPSAYANAWAAKKYKAAGGGWRKSENIDEASMTGNLDGGEGPPKTPYAFQSKKQRAQDKKKENEIATNSTGFVKMNENKLNEAKGWDLLNNVLGKYAQHHTKKLMLALKKKDEKLVRGSIGLLIGGLQAAMKSTLDKRGFQLDESINEATKREVNALKKFIRDFDKMQKQYWNIAKMGDQELKNPKYNKHYETILKAQKSIVKLAREIQEKERVGEGLNEGRYHDWRNDESLTPKQKIGKSMREVRDSLNELSKTIDMSVKLKNELKVDTTDYWKTTHKALGKISERLVKLANKVGKLQ
jgi:hypothetical protein